MTINSIIKLLLETAWQEQKDSQTGNVEYVHKNSKIELKIIFDLKNKGFFFWVTDYKNSKSEFIAHYGNDADIELTIRKILKIQHKITAQNCKKILSGCYFDYSTGQ